MRIHLEGCIPHLFLQFEDGERPLRIYIKGFGRIFSWASFETSTLPFYLVDLKLEKIVNAKEL
jgi:hypothetical protein